MAININLQQLATLNNTSILGQMNANFSIIQNALVQALSLTGQAPNQMQSNLDMNNGQILNLPPPATPNSPVRLVDVTSPAVIASVPPVGTNGAVVPLLNGNNTWSGTNAFANLLYLVGDAVFGSNGVNGGSINLQGSVSGYSYLYADTGGVFNINSYNGQTIINAYNGNSASLALAGINSGSFVISASNIGGFQLDSTNGIAITNGGCFSNPGGTAATIPNSPAGSIPAGYLVITDNNGIKRYIPCF